jgi:hypothetical protein
MMKRKITLVLIVGLFVLVSAFSFTEQQLVDVVYLNDGTVLTGLIVDQVPGASLKLATADRLVYTLSNQEIEKVAKEKTREPLPFYYSDVVLLKDGVMFSGMIVEQRPDTSLTLRTENDVMLTFDTDEVWKILKEKRISGTPEEGPTEKERAERRRWRLSLQIEMVGDRIRRGEQKASAGTGAAGIESEIDALKEQMESLEQEEEQVEYETFTERRVEERERLEDLQQDIDRILTELLELLEQCEKRSDEEQTTYLFTVPQMKPLRFLEIGGFASDISSGSVFLAAEKQSEEEISQKLSSAAAEIVEQTIYKIPTQAQIDALEERQFAYSSLTNILGTSRWKVASTRGMMRGMAELLPVEDRVFLYETHKQRGAVPFALLNIIPFVCLGSWAQGDGWGASIGIVQSTAAIPAGVLLIIDDASAKGYDSLFSSGYFPGDMGALAWAGAGMVIASYAFNIIEPFWFVSRMNKRLKNRLLLDDETIRDVKREERKAAVNPPALRIRPGENSDLAVQLDLVSVSY